MSFQAAFTASQSAGNARMIHLVDASAGSDVAIVSRRIYLQKADGTFLVPTGSNITYILWPTTDMLIDLNVLDKDYALFIKIDYLDSGNNVLYTTADTFPFTIYGRLFSYKLVQLLAANPQLKKSSTFIENMELLGLYLDSAVNAITFSADVAASQACLDLAKNLVDNQKYYF